MALITPKNIATSKLTDGSNFLTSIDHTNFPTGTIIQHQYTEVLRVGHWSSSSSSYIEISSMNVNIVPKYANSRIYVIAEWFVHAQTGSPYMDWTFFRTLSGGSATNIAGAGLNSKMGEYASGADGSDNTYDRLHCSFIDSTHNSTSQINYSYRMKKYSGSNNFYAHSNGQNYMHAYEIKL